MEKERFRSFLEENILTIFTGSEIAGEEPSSVRDGLVAGGTGGSVLVKRDKSDEYRFVIKRIQPFKSFEISLIRAILNEVRKIRSFTTDREYFKKFEEFAIEKSICEALSKNSAHILFELVGAMTSWGSRTYEGRRPELGFLVSTKKAPKGTNPNLSVLQMLEKDYSAVLSDGKKTCIEVSADGFVLEYKNLPRIKQNDLYTPNDYLRIAAASRGQKVGLVLNAMGDILLFKENMLVFAKKRGKWLSFSHEEIINRLAERRTESVDEVRKAVYLSSLDVAFAGTGGCIVHLNREDGHAVLRHINKIDIMQEDCYEEKCQEDLSQSFFFGIKQENEVVKYEEFLREDRCVKLAGLRQIVGGKKFHELGRQLRQDLLAIDGATVIDADGNIIAVGAIIQIEAGSTGGGRLAATKTLSKFGVAIKISADGSIEGYRMDKQKLHPKPIFMI